MAQANYTPIQLYRSTTASAVPTSGNLADGELAINTNDGKLYYKDSGGIVQLIASKAGASGDVVGPASATDNAIVRFDGATGKLVQNSVVTIADSTGDISGVGQLNATTVDATNLEVTNIKAKDGTAAATIADSTGVVSITANPILSGGTANGVLYLNGSKVATSGSALTFDGTNLGVGTSSPSTYGKLAVVGTGTVSSRSVATDSGGDASFFVQNNDGRIAGPLVYGTTKSAYGALGSNETAFYSNSSTTIMADGASQVIKFAAGGNTERARITSGGELLVGTTDTSSTSGTGLKITAGSSNADSLSIVTGATTNAGLTTYQLYSTGAAAYRFYVGAGGTVFATNTTISAISDQRLKENIQGLDVGLDAVMALKPRKFDWKAGKGKDIKGDRGWIAQEFEQVFPDMIDTWKDEAPEGEEPYKSVRADLIPVLVKAIQEQQALIESLTTRVAQLEGTQP